MTWPTWKQDNKQKGTLMPFNSQAEAIKKMRSKKNQMDDFFTGPELEAGVEDLAPNLRQETDLAPSLKGQEREAAELNDGDDVPVVDSRVQMNMQDQGLDQGDAVLPKGMYEPGDENKKGFMGKAAMKMKQAMGMKQVKTHSEQ